MRSRTLHIFTRDLRIHDNLALDAARNGPILGCFILNPAQLNPKKNKYRSEKAVQFMMNCLADLATEVPLHIFKGDPVVILKRLLRNGIHYITRVTIMRDYTPFARHREAALKAVAEANGVEFMAINDLMLTGSPTAVMKPDGTSYKMFTPYYRTAVESVPARPLGRRRYKFVNGYIKGELIEPIERVGAGGGRAEALRLLADAITRLADYDKVRDNMSTQTTGLSAYNKFGCLSIREFYWQVRNALGPKNGLLKQLYWRDFYHQILWHHPEVLRGPMKQQYANIKWSKDRHTWHCWTTGTTGVPIVDAAMRQLNETGIMHNRGRMIVANFLIKILHHDWRKGEMYFATHLTDYDVAVNNGSWQWSASTGTDSQPYFRVFNPWLQMAKYDRECEYIRRWIPELQDVPTRDILKWNERWANYPGIYCQPVVDNLHERAQQFIELYKQ